MKSPLLLTVLFTVCTSALAEDRLVMAQTLWRHGARTPTGSYPTDRYQESFWGVPWGELTTTGMSQHFEQGTRLRKRYIEQTGLLSQKYSRYETTVRSADTPRCLQSAAANLAGFYAGSQTFPLDANGWPSTWTPVPIHSMPHDEDKELEAGGDCPRADKLKEKREKTHAFQEWLASKSSLFAAIQQSTGENFDVSISTLKHMLGILRVQKEDFNLTMPSWVSDDFYANLVQAVNEGLDFTVGAPGFGKDEKTELLRLRGGFMLKEFVKNLNDSVNNATSTKYFAYSGHDTIERAVLMTLGLKNATVGSGNPDYASVIAVELWMRNEQYYVKILYAPDSQTDLIDYTTALPLNCSDGFCPLTDFIHYAGTYMPKGPKDCHD